MPKKDYKKTDGTLNTSNIKTTQKTIPPMVTELQGCVEKYRLAPKGHKLANTQISYSMPRQQ